jgi:pimeloyl-ACP methyl ester carboxylesterase
VRKTFELVLRRGDIWNVDRFKQLPEDSPERQLNLLGMLEREEFPGETFLPDDEMDYFVDTFEATGFTGGLNWYRNMGRFAPAMANAKWHIDVPCLYVGAEHDVILRPSSSDGMGDFIKDFETYVVKDCGHWTQQEKPEEVNRVLIDWLNRKFKK